jgi:hypothetical protein
MPSNSVRLNEVMRHIGRIKTGAYPGIVGGSDDYRIVERPWREIPETSKLAILKDAVDWSGITNRDQAHILLAAIDPRKIPDGERNRLIDMAQEKLSVKGLREAGGSTDARERGQQHDRGMER